MKHGGRDTSGDIQQDGGDPSSSDEDSDASVEDDYSDRPFFPELVASIEAAIADLGGWFFASDCDSELFGCGALLMQ
jgi:hypothetical protein